MVTYNTVHICIKIFQHFDKINRPYKNITQHLTCMNSLKDIITSIDGQIEIHCVNTAYNTIIALHLMAFFNTSKTFLMQTKAAFIVTKKSPTIDGKCQMFMKTIEIKFIINNKYGI